MRKFECRRCAKTCTLLLDENLAIPRSCIYGNRESLWCAIKEDSAENEQFGNSEQLPDWVKVGELIYCGLTKHYAEITEIKGEVITMHVLDSIMSYSLDIYKILQMGYPARKRPFNADEIKSLIGKVLRGDKFDFCALITYTEAETIETQHFTYTSDELINDYTIDGKPCFKLEHLENGEWVE
jgi:hypothetical protein